mgnify:CR=1 FL=1
MSSLQFERVNTADNKATNVLLSLGGRHGAGFTTEVITKVKLMNAIKKFIRDEEGLTTVEYAVAGALIAATVVTAFELLGQQVETRIEQITTDIS